MESNDMKRPLTEQKILKALDIPDFRHLSKEKIITFSSMLSNMDKEVAKKALDQFPNFASATSELAKEYSSKISEALSINLESSKYVYEAYNRELDALLSMLDKDNLSSDEKFYIMERMHIVTTAIDAKDTETKKNNLKMLGIGGVVALGFAAILGSALGSNIGVKTNDECTSDDEDIC